MNPYCSDCIYYQSGGWCRKRKKETSPLAQHTCFEGITPMTTQTTTQMETQTKKCSICGKELPLEAYSKNARNKDGYMPFCKECHKVSAKKGGRGHKAENEPLPQAEIEPQVEKVTITMDAPEVEAVRALGKVFGSEKIGIWMEINSAYELFVKYFKAV